MVVALTLVIEIATGKRRRLISQGGGCGRGTAEQHQGRANGRKDFLTEIHHNPLTGSLT